MVLDHYKLREQPFGVTPDSRYLYASATHREALASLLYGIETRRGFVALIAKPGMGKTTLLFHALELLRDKATTVFLFQTMSTPADFLRALLADLGVPDAQGGLVELQSKLNDVLAEYSRSGKRLVVVIDEAQKLDDSVLELARMLSNFETAQEKLIQIVLSGQPQLAEKLASPELVQLRQRVSIVASLKPFSPEETASYIDHRLRIAGHSPDTRLFTDSALALIAQSSDGIPRNINNLCFNALSLGCAMKRKTIDNDIVREVIADLDLEPLREKRSPAAPIEDPNAQAAPALTHILGRHSVPAKWLPRLAVAAVVSIAAAGALIAGARFRNSRPVPGETLVQADSKVPSLVPADQPALIRKPGPGVAFQPGAPASAGEVRVRPGQTLYGICTENFGGCNGELLQEIHRLNPRLSNLDHIEAGQRIRIPVAGNLPQPTQETLDQSASALTAERGTQ